MKILIEINSKDSSAEWMDVEGYEEFMSVVQKFLNKIMAAVKGENHGG